LGARKLNQRICGLIEVAEDCEAGLIRRLLIEHHVDTGSRRRRTEDIVRLKVITNERRVPACLFYKVSRIGLMPTSHNTKIEAATSPHRT
jgi:hypothetical protein